MCREYVEDLVTVPQSSFENTGSKLVIIGCAPSKFISSFKSDLKIPYEVYCDPKREIYLTLGLRHGAFSDKVKSPHIKSGMFKGIVKGIALGVSGGLQLQGDFLQQGGCFIVKPNGEVLFSHIDESPQDHTPINTILNVIGAPQMEF